MIFKLGFGPMSTEIIDILCNYSHNTQSPLMLIASRNQIDANSGYVMTTPKLATQLSSNNTDYLLTCRDHCGPYFLDNEKTLSLSNAIKATKKTIAYDIEQGFDLIHIDTSRVDDTYGIAEELIKFSLNLNPNIKFEFGTEENVGVAAGAIRYKEDVAFAKQFSNMEFVVAQTGSLVYEDHQAGTFEDTTVRQLVALADANNIKLKEHNADYLASNEIQLRKLAGVHALNIAPQLGVIQTKLLESLARDYQLCGMWDNFATTVLDSQKWKKWTKTDNTNIRVHVAGHYCFASSAYKRLIDEINKHTQWEEQLSLEMYKLLDLYVGNIG